VKKRGDACCAAVTLAEVCRGRDRTRRVEATIARDRGGRRLTVVPTDERLAKLVVDERVFAALVKQAVHYRVTIITNRFTPTGALGHG
jgi:hypothetical protein